MNGVFNQEECLFKFETSKQHSKRSKQSSKGPNTVINNGHPSPQDLNAGSSATTPTTLPPPRFGTVKLSSGSGVRQARLWETCCLPPRGNIN
jgi:hypothetical protein